MKQIADSKKSLSDGEFGLLIVFACLAFFSLYVASQAYTSAYAFHAGLFCAGSAAAIFALLKRYEWRHAGPLPTVIGGKPNYNFGPVKFASLAAVFWGIAGFAVGLYIALELAFPWLNLDLPFVKFRTAAAASHVRGHFRFRRQCFARDLFLRRAAHFPRPARRRSCAVVRDPRL